MFFRGSCLRAPRFPRPLPLHVRSIEDAFFSSQSLTVLLVGRAGWLHLQRRQNHLPAPPARTAPLRSSPSSALLEDSSHASRERKIPLQGFSLGSRCSYCRSARSKPPKFMSYPSNRGSSVALCNLDGRAAMSAVRPTLVGSKDSESLVS